MNEKQAQDLASQIRELAPNFDQLSTPFRIDPDTEQEFEFDLNSSNDWRRDTYGNVLVRLRQLTEKNFLYIETLALLAVTRYIFEVHVWLRLFQVDDRYCLVYRHELSNTMLRYYQDTLDQLKREIELFKSIHEREKNQRSDILSKIRAEPSTENGIRTTLRNAMKSVDDEASLHFSIFAEDAKTNGYGYQAYIIESQAVPATKDAILEIEQQIKDIPEHIQKFNKGTWRKMAERAGMVDEYDYIYSYVSKLLHATPASITTDQKNLQYREVCMFLRYIRLKLQKIIDLSREQPELRNSI